MEAWVIALAGLAISGLFTVLWFLLRQKDEQQASQIRELFIKHEQDAAELQTLRLQIANGYHPKDELNARFASLDSTFRDVGQRLEGKFDELQKVLLSHMSQHSGGH